MSQSRRIVAMPPVEAISAKFVQEGETCSSEKAYKSVRYFGARIKKTTSRNLFYFRKNPLPAPSSAQLSARAIFKFAKKWQEYTITDPTLVASATSDFKNGKTLQGCNPRQYTFFGWVFVVRYNQKSEDPQIEVGDTTYKAWPTA